MTPHQYQLIAVLLLIIFVPLSRLLYSLWKSIACVVIATAAWAYLGFSVLLQWFDRTGRAQSEKGFAIWCIVVFGGIALIAFIADLPAKIEDYRSRQQRRKDRARQAGRHLTSDDTGRLSAEEVSTKLRKMAEAQAAQTQATADAATADAATAAAAAAAPVVNMTRPITSADAEAMQAELASLRNEVARKDRLIAQLTEALMQQQGALPGNSPK